MAAPTILHKKGDQHLGFAFEAVTPLPELRAVAYQLRHGKSGARLLHLHADDEENLFSVSFPTLPQDHSGVAHILEHSVLSGSVRFPVRDPFFEMVKMSMATFINAMTGWDCTFYPVASNVTRDLFNLAEVYFDAVFHPLLTEETFRREGHHRALDENGRLIVKGIVYNEMKGVFSDPRSLMYRRMTRGLFPDTIYNRESGGDPQDIPNLTWEGLRAFHAKWYHPSNAYFVLYGDTPTTTHLDFLAGRLDAFDKREIDATIAYQPRWTAPRRARESYPIGKGESTKEETFLGLHWLVGDALDVEESALFSILDLVLLGNEAAPMKKALIDSKLGQDILYTGSAPVGLENSFCLGLKGSEPDRVDAFEKVVFDTLTKLASAPLPSDLIETAFRQAAFHVREVQPQYPLTAMERVLESWIYGSDPLTFLKLAEHLDACKARIAKDPMLLPRLIQARLLDNPHRLLAVLEPDPDLADREQAAFEAKMAEIKAALDADAIQAIAKSAEELEAKSGVPNSPEALATLPQLRVSDLPQQPRHIDTTVEDLGGADLLRNDVFSNGVSYLALDFDLAGLPEELIPWLPYYTDSLEKMGVAASGFEEVARRVASATGGISASPYFETAISDRSQTLMRIRVRTKMLDEQVDEALSILHDMLFTTNPDDKARQLDVVAQSRSWVRNHLVHQGSSTATRHASRGISLPSQLGERVFGLPQLPLVEGLHADFDARYEELIRNVVAIRDFLLRRGRFVASFTGSDAAYERVRVAIAAWNAKMRKDDAAAAAVIDFQPETSPRSEGLAGPIQIAHCALALPAPHFSDGDGVLLSLGSRILSLDYLINEIRFKGNAYGASCSYDGLDSVFSFNSYRDPNIARTIEVFRGARDHIAGSTWSAIDIERAVIGSAKHDGAPIRPGAATAMALTRHLRGFTREMREDRYQQLLNASPTEVRRAMLALFDENMGRAAVCVVSNEEMLKEANAELETPLEIRRILD